MTIKTEPFDIADYLTTRERIVEYIAAVLEDDAPEYLEHALRDISRAVTNLP